MQKKTKSKCFPASTSNGQVLKKEIFSLNSLNLFKYGCSKWYSTQPATKNETTKQVKSKPENYVNPMKQVDFFGVHSLVTIKDLFDARVHFGHREDTLNNNMRRYIFGSRLGHLIFDLEQTAQLMRDALNFAAHISYRGGIILFASNYHQHCPLIEQTALDCQEYAHSRNYRKGLFTNATKMFDGTIRLPDLIIFLSTLNNVLQTHVLVHESAKMLIPTIGVVDTNSDPTIITYPIPGNDDSLCAIELYCKLLKTAILRGKEFRQKELTLYGG